MEIFLSIAKNAVRRGFLRADFDEVEVGQYLHSMRGVRAAGYLACFLFHGNEFTIDNDDLIRSSTKSSRRVFEQV